MRDFNHGEVEASDILAKNQFQQGRKESVWMECGMGLCESVNL
eukprot:CAMPEP_0119397402 /NCGR_PEP_ID=MMETSP1334-20130426/140315_1 /TAXON_ID=127549 /ORGANISM="Calcidiscus leptoporus, Strain RCC1130" /LENGTH=42 /DNA_ID= /DNA_START= /DNA_END= /DNA_ORIENTATION=